MKRLLAGALTLCLLLAGCTANPAPSAVGATDLTGALTPLDEPVAPVDDYRPMTAFGLSLFSRLLQEEAANPVISPASAYLCLAMVQNGADTDTLKEFSQVLGLDTDALNRLCRAFAAGASDTKGDTVLSLADAVFADDDRAHILDSYLQTLVDHFDAEAYTVDLPSDAGLAAVNAWVNEKTRGMIPTLHEQNYPNDTVLVLLNTLYFKALWQSRFEPHNTGDADFTTASGKTVTAPFLHAYWQTLPLFADERATGAVLPYNDGKTALIALLPTGDARAFAASLTPETLAGYLSGAQDRLVNLSLPKFTVEYGTNMSDALQDMGLSLVFDAEKADLTRMGTGENGPLYLSWVIQKVKIIVDEEGTEAAAVTEAAAAEGAFLPEEPPVELHFDRPFVYAVVDLQTGVPLFLGLMDDPTAAAGAPAPTAAAAADAPVLSADLYALLQDVQADCHPGTAGSSLTAARLAGQLLDYASTAAPVSETVTATVQAFLATLSAEDRTLFAEQLNSVSDAALALTADGAADLLEAAGYAPAAYPWQPDAAKTLFAALLAGLE